MDRCVVCKRRPVLGTGSFAWCCLDCAAALYQRDIDEEEQRSARDRGAILAGDDGARDTVGGCETDAPGGL